jgi:hypothetical protein
MDASKEEKEASFNKLKNGDLNVRHGGFSLRFEGS